MQATYIIITKSRNATLWSCPLSAAIITSIADRPAQANFSKEQNEYTVHDACHHMHGHITCPKGSSRWDLTCLHSQPSPTSLSTDSLGPEVENAA